jgi:hypothetical protein
MCAQTQYKMNYFFNNDMDLKKTQILNNDQKEKPSRIIYKIHMLQNP